MPNEARAIEALTTPHCGGISVRHVSGHRAACVCRGSVAACDHHRYQSIRDPLIELRLRLRELAQSRIRYGYRRPRVLLLREG